MGFSWARPTTFTEPMFTVGDNVHYYGVDHSPSYLWNSATWENSEALIPYLRTVLDGPSAWDADETIRRAIEIQAAASSRTRRSWRSSTARRSTRTSRHPVKNRTIHSSARRQAGVNDRRLGGVGGDGRPRRGGGVGGVPGSGDQAAAVSGGRRR